MGGVSVYDRAGGRAWFVALVARFYLRVESDPVLRPLYPDDLGPGSEHLAAFLAQYCGGPPDYEAARGHPRLRRRHFPFAIGREQRDAWVAHMSAAVREGGLTPADEAEMLAYFESAATGLINS
jgi:hemoglobin